MTFSPACPDPSRLAAMLDQSLPPAEQESIQQHVSECSACQLRLDVLVDGAGAADLPLNALGEEAGSAHSRGARSAAEVHSPAAEAAAIPLTFLAPSSEPGSLGRLGQYEVLEVIGRGGMGIVLKGRDTRLCRIVAIKVLAPELAANPTAHKRFLREAQAAAAVSHDHVITIFAVEPGPVPFLVMELIDGCSLQEKIDAEGYMQLEEVLRIGHQIAAGLAAAHALGLIHRDIKPTNILLQNGIQRVQITDFGLARAVDDVGMTHSGEVHGTPQFMSPEQAQGQPVDHRADLFSLGCVLYSMCTGRSPFRAESPVASLRLVCDATPRPIRAINPAIPAWLPPIVDRLLAKDPAQRHQSAGEVAALLGQHLAELQNPAAAPSAARAPLASLRANGHAGRRRGWVIGAIALVAALGVLGVTEATSVTNLTSTVIRVVSGEGALIVELDDPTIKVTIDGEEVVITEAGAREVRVRPGRHKVAATKDGKPAAVSEDLVSISRGGRRVVRVTYEQPAAPAALPEPDIAATSAESPERSAKRVPIIDGRKIAEARNYATAPFSATAALAYQGVWSRKLELPVEYTNSVGMKLRLIPPGRFHMGSPQADVDEALPFMQSLPMGPALLDSETPQHPVHLNEPWWMGMLEVTQEQYEAVCGDNPSYFPAERKVSADAANLDRAADPADRRRRSKYPVDSVSWLRAVEFCNRLSRLEGLAEAYVLKGEAWTLEPGPGYRLPTEAQWEFACRAGSSDRYPYPSNSAQELPGYAWFSRNSGRATRDVGTRRPNAFGLYDMLGNVAEWCQDGWDPLAYGQSGEEAAIDPVGPVDGFSLRVIRGGNWQSSPVNVRPASRGALEPQTADPKVGFRVVLPVAGVKTLVMRSGAPVSSSPKPPRPRGEPP